MRVASTCVVAVALAAAAAAPAAPLLGAPPSLVGKWTRTVTDADRQRQGGGAIPAGRWTMLIDRRANVTFAGPGHMVVTGIVEVRGGRVQFDAGASGVNTYAWKRDGRMLTFRLIADATGDRRAVVVGRWRHE
jgi:hypothetical protein